MSWNESGGKGQMNNIPTDREDMKEAMLADLNKHIYEIDRATAAPYDHFKGGWNYGYEAAVKVVEDRLKKTKSAHPENGSPGKVWLDAFKRILKDLEGVK